MNDWASGYISDIPYMAIFYHDQSPTHLNFICLLNGFQPRSLDKGFTYCELGCGCGLTTNVLAATNPCGRFYAMDFHPAHIAEAHDTAAAARLENVTFFEKSFAEFLDETLTDLPAFDFITLHGVYSWVSAGDQQRITEIIHRRLKPGGIVYISYNSLPGWSGGEPIQRLLYECATLFSDRSDRRFEKALSLLQEFQEQKSPILSESPFVDRVTDTWRSKRVGYLTHEYLSRNWHPQYHVDVARRLAAAKLVFTGSANALDNFPDLNFTKPRQTLLAKIGSPEVQETLRDYFVPRLLRKDVFVRGPQRLNRIRQEELLKQLRLALILPRQHAKLSMEVPVGEVSADASVFVPVLDALAERPHTMEELLAISGAREKSAEKAAEIAGILIGTRQAAPTVAPGTTTSQDAVNHFNLVMAQRAIMEDLGEQFPLASPILGSGIQASGLEMRVYQAALKGKSIDTDDFATRLWKPLAARGERLLKNGIPLEEENDNLALLKETIEAVLEQKSPVWRNLNIL